MTASSEGGVLNLSLERDAEIGRDTYRRLQRLNARLSRNHGLEPDRAVDFLVGGVLFLVADLHDCSIDEAAQMVSELACSIQQDVLRPETRH